jgi:hypothetical protein
VWKLLFYDIMYLLTRTIRYASPYESLFDLRDAIHGVVIVKTFDNCQLVVVSHLAKHLSK